MKGVGANGGRRGAENWKIHRQLALTGKLYRKFRRT